MSRLTETARAKVNLTLEVLGRRPDGFHELFSLVAFADLGDELELLLSDEFSLDLSGPFAGPLEGSVNIVTEAAKLLEERAGNVASGCIHLVKNLPVAAGLGGGSADAAAFLRLMMRANPDVPVMDVIHELALELGSDVPACLDSTAAFMRGRGEKLSAVTEFPPLACVLVNPGAQLSAGEVYSALKASPVAEDCERLAPTSFMSRENLVELIASSRNDLEAPARELAPDISKVLDVLSAQERCELARMSGSGATCFGLFPDPDAAGKAAESISEKHPEWWVRDAILS